MERRKFVKYAGLAGLAAGLFPTQSLSAMTPKSSAHLLKFAGVSTQIRHGALNIPFASAGLEEMPFKWVLDVHQNIFLKDGFQRNVEADMNVISVALAVGDKFDALQINKQPGKISFLWKEQWLDCASGLPMQELAIVDDNYTFHLGHISEGTSLTFEQKSNVDYFVQVIDGQIQNQENVLDTESGLGLISDIDLQQNFLAKTESSVLIIARDKNGWQNFYE
jgi:hypothetical protein